MNWRGIAAGTVVVVLCLTGVGAAQAQVTRSTPGQPEARTARDLMPAKKKLTVTTPAFKDGGDIPFENTQYRTNTFPGLTWSKGPKATKSYVIIMQDNSLILRGAPILHWTMFNIPAGVTRLDAGMAPDGKPAGSSYGPNVRGASKPYMGPHTPPNMKDNYHFQVFALDTSLPDEATADYVVLTKAMDGHVLASGEVVGVGQADPNAPPRPPAPHPAAN
ncbi:MAG TPA: YbhB/YbcL family Raf kinase inhibitor-like protein [Caulobacteraceae bacterium]|jgi:para-nitrobenzyl esterase|nr:YbhB/YbcL family Raf kinase inhibitor-like protein [Caulobacteraceae bacterium]